MSKNECETVNKRVQVCLQNVELYVANQKRCDCFYYHRNSLCIKEKVHLTKRPPFNVCKKEAVSSVSYWWRKSCLPIINEKSITIKFENLITDYEKAKIKQNDIGKLGLDRLFDVCSCTCGHRNAA